MTKKIDLHATRLKEVLESVEHQLSRAGNHLKLSSEKGVDAFEAERKKAVEKCEEKKEQALHAGQRISKRMEETKKDAVNKFENWKTDHEVHKIEKQADKKEQLAIDSIEVAAYAILEAEVAILDALKFRKMAIEVAG